MTDLRHDLTRVINHHSAENGSNTPDFLLARFLLACLAAFDETVNERAHWYGRFDSPGRVGEVQMLCGKPSCPWGYITTDGKAAEDALVAHRRAAHGEET